jgi:hypothetical protein
MPINNNTASKQLRHQGNSLPDGRSSSGKYGSWRRKERNFEPAIGGYFTYRVGMLERDVKERR